MSRKFSSHWSLCAVALSMHLSAQSFSYLSHWSFMCSTAKHYAQHLVPVICQSLVLFPGFELILFPGSCILDLFLLFVNCKKSVQETPQTATAFVPSTLLTWQMEWLSQSLTPSRMLKEPKIHGSTYYWLLGVLFPHLVSGGLYMFWKNLLFCYL